MTSLPDKPPENLEVTMPESNRLHLAIPGRRLGAGLAFLLCLLLTSPGWGADEAKAPAASPAQAAAATPQPEKILQQACDLLKSAQQFSFKAEVTDDRVYTGGKKLQFAFDLEAYVQRPDKLRINGQGDIDSKQFIYDGKTITLYDQDKNAYAVMPAPASIDAALDLAHKEYGLTVALADLAHSNAGAVMAKGQKHALYVGEGLVRGVTCHHLAFDRDDIQWQIWIEAGEKPLIRKIVINQKKLPAEPQWTAYLTDWNLAPQLSGSLFVFTPPEKAVKAKFVSLKEAAAAPQKAAPKKKAKKGDKS
jgi:hypothetical protein